MLCTISWKCNKAGTRLFSPRETKLEMEGDEQVLAKNEEGNFVADWVRRNQEQQQRRGNKTELLNPYVRWYFFIAGQWFAPVEGIIKAKNLPRRGCRIAYAVWQAIVVLIMWSFFLYSMGFLTLRTLKEVDWLCPLTDIKNMIHGLCWIVIQHTGLIFFSRGNLERILEMMSITKDKVKKSSSSHSISIFVTGSVAWLFVVPIILHSLQMLVPEFIPMPRCTGDGKITVFKNNTFPHLQVALDVIFYTASRGFSLPVFYVFLYLLLFLCCEVENFKDELNSGDYTTEQAARQKAKKIKELINETEKAFRFFLALYITMLLLASALEIFSIVEKAETVITANHTVHCIPASDTVTSLQTLELGSQNLMAFPHRLAGKRSIPYWVIVVPPVNHTVGMGTGPGAVNKIVVDEYKVKTLEIVVTAVLDITENVVFYALPLYQMSVLKSCLKSVVEMVDDSDCGDRNADAGNDVEDNDPGEQHADAPLRIAMPIFKKRQDKKDFREYFRDNCTSGIRVLGREVSFFWTLVLTFFGPFVVVVVNLMFKHIHVESPWH